MKFSAIISAVIFPLTSLAAPITQKPLNEFIIYRIPIAQKTGTTTILFPAEISGFSAKSVAVQEQPNAAFLRRSRRAISILRSRPWRKGPRIT
jgi:hypothetical protein